MKKNLRYEAYEKIKNKIIYFDLKLGEKINESKIADELNMSRTPIREALLILESEKLIQCQGRAGFYVRKLSLQDTNHYFQLRVLIEEFAAPLIFENITTADKKALQKNLKSAQKALDQKNIKRLIQYETEFHQILYKSSRSEALIETIIPLSDKFHWLRSIGLHAPGGAEGSLTGHKKIFSAVKRNDIKEYKREMKKHFEEAQSKYSIMQGLFI